MSAYKDLDDAILSYIRSGEPVHPIYSQGLSVMAADELLVSTHDKRVWRLIDRRMQSLRKAGRIKYDRFYMRWEAL